MARDLHDHVSKVLANAPVVVLIGQLRVEVRPFGVTKGQALSFIFREMGLSKEEDGEERREGEGEEMTQISDHPHPYPHPNWKARGKR